MVINSILTAFVGFKIQAHNNYTNTGKLHSKTTLEVDTNIIHSVYAKYPKEVDTTLPFTAKSKTEK
jgi:hypothetical protein